MKQGNGLVLWDRLKSSFIIICTFVIKSQIEIEEADLAIPFGYGCFYGLSRVAFCSSTVVYLPNHFFTRYPIEKTRLWNLKNLLTPTSWFAYLITISIVTICFKLFSYVGSKLGLNTVTEEIPLIPFRYILFMEFSKMLL